MRDGYRLRPVETAAERRARLKRESEAVHVTMRNAAGSKSVTIVTPTDKAPKSVCTVVQPICFIYESKFSLRALQFCLQLR
jgi:hypothetical protein